MDSRGGGRGRGRGRPILGSGAPEVGGLQSPRSALRVDAQEFVPRTQGGPSAAPQYHEGDHECPSKEDPIDLLRQTIFALSQNPGEFDEQMSFLQVQLVSLLTDEKSLVGAIGEIVSLCIEDPNMAYMGAKMCSSLSQDDRLKVESGNFRQHLMKAMRSEYMKKDDCLRNPAQHRRLCGFARFLGEVLLCCKAADGSPFDVLIQSIEDIIIGMLTQQTEALLKCAGQVLKLTGRCLEAHKRRRSEASKLDQIFHNIRTIIVENQDVGKTVKYFLLAIVEQRAGRWGEDDSETESSTAAPTSAVGDLRISNEPVYFGPQGQVITAEEAGFSSTNEDDQSTYQNGFFPQEPEMDEEAEKAYDEFLQLQQYGHIPYGQ